MGLQDYTYRVKAQSGDTTIHDEEGVSGDMSGGTQTLVDMGSGDYAWQIASGRACPRKGTRKVWTVASSRATSSASSRRQWPQPGSLNTTSRWRPRPRTVVIASA